MTEKKTETETSEQSGLNQQQASTVTNSERKADTASQDAKKIVVKVLFPVDVLNVPGLPSITKEGTKLTQEQFEQATEAAKKRGITLKEVK